MKLDCKRLRGCMMSAGEDRAASEQEIRGAPVGSPSLEVVRKGVGRKSLQLFCQRKGGMARKWAARGRTRGWQDTVKK